MLSPEYISKMAAEGIKINPKEGPIDPGVVGLVVALNRYGIKTESSCDGHGQYGVNVTFFTDVNPNAEAALRSVISELPDKWRIYVETKLYNVPRKKMTVSRTEVQLSAPLPDAFGAAERLAQLLEGRALINSLA